MPLLVLVTPASAEAMFVAGVELKTEGELLSVALLLF